MSVSFNVVGDVPDFDFDNASDEEVEKFYEALVEREVSTTNMNARVLLNAIGAPGADGDQPSGSLPASELARLCMHFVNTTASDPGQDARVTKRPGQATFIEAGQRPGLIHHIVNRLWKMAQAAPSGAIITWG